MTGRILTEMLTYYLDLEIWDKFCFSLPSLQFELFTVSMFFFSIRKKVLELKRVELSLNRGNEFLRVYALVKVILLT